MRGHLLEAARVTALGVPRRRAVQGDPPAQRTRRAAASRGGCRSTAGDKRQRQGGPAPCIFRL
jgi:hypothetical protein